jgi:hypothetical protein
MATKLSGGVCGITTTLLGFVITAMIKGHALKLEPTDINPLPRFRLLTPQLHSNTTPTPAATDQQAQQESHFYPPTRAIASQSKSSTEQEKLHFDSQTTAAFSRAGLTPIRTAKVSVRTYAE